MVDLLRLREASSRLRDGRGNADPMTWGETYRDAFRYARVLRDRGAVPDAVRVLVGG